MSAPEGNKFWMLRAKHGRDMLFSTPNLMWKAATEYFEWCEEHPLKEQQLFAYQGVVTKETVEKVRAFTWAGLCLYLDCSEQYFRAFKDQKHKDFIQVVNAIEKTIYEQKFTNAAAGLLNTNIIARDLGLKDHADLTSNNETLQQLPPPDPKRIKEIRDKLNDEY